MDDQTLHQRSQALVFSQAQLERLLKGDELINAATQASVNSALEAMERGLFAKLFPKRAALKVLKLSGATRQAEMGPTTRWISASIVESLAMLKLLSINSTRLQSVYASSRDNVVLQIAEIVEGRDELRSTTRSRAGISNEFRTPSPKLPLSPETDVSVGTDAERHEPIITRREGLFRSSFISTGPLFSRRGAGNSNQERKISDAKLDEGWQNYLRTNAPGVLRPGEGASEELHTPVEEQVAARKRK